MESTDENVSTLDFQKTLKQDYIRDQIQNAGYDGVEFQAYLDKLKPSGIQPYLYSKYTNSFFFARWHESQ